MKKVNRYVILCTHEQFVWCMNNFEDFGCYTNTQIRLLARGIESLLFKGIPLVHTRPGGYGIINVRSLTVNVSNGITFMGMIKLWRAKFYETIYK